MSLTEHMTNLLFLVSEHSLINRNDVRGGKHGEGQDRGVGVDSKTTR